MYKRLTSILLLTILFLISISLVQAASCGTCWSCDFSQVPEWPSEYANPATQDRFMQAACWTGGSMNPSGTDCNCHCGSYGGQERTLPDGSSQTRTCQGVPGWGTIGNWYWSAWEPSTPEIEEIYLNIPDIYLEDDSGLVENILDLLDYTDYEGNYDDLEYWVSAETRPDIVECWVDDTFLSCNVYGFLGSSDITVTVADSVTGAETSDTFTVYVEEYDDEYEITDLECFEHVIVNHDQSCSIYVEYLGEPVGNLDVDVYYDDGTLFGSCVTDDLSGGCEVQDLQTSTGSRTVYAVAGDDDDMEPYFDYEVMDERYDIVNLFVYNDSAYSQEDYDFFRGQSLYVAFQVLDMWNNNDYAGEEIVTEAELVSPPGGRVELENVPGLGLTYWFYYALDAIPPVHDFLGLSQVFTFAFNFEDYSGGEEEVDLIIRNNPPVIGDISDIETDIVYELDLSQYENDVEDSGDDLTWAVSDVNEDLFEAELIGKTLRITPRELGEDDITLTLTDLDGDSDTEIVNVRIVEETIDDRTMNSDLAILGLRVVSDEFLHAGDVLQLSVYLENHANEDLENLKIAVVVQELGISRRNGPFDLDEGKGVSKRIFLDVPEDAEPGFYSIRITTSNDNIRRVRYRDFAVI